MTLKIHDLSFSYPNKPVLNAITTGEIPSGQLTALLGPNAAGKSTFFRCIAGLQKPQTGHITLDDKDLQAIHQSERIQNICYMPQNFSSSAALTVFEVILLARKHLGNWHIVEDDIKAVTHILERFGIADLAAQYISELSGGQQQIVALCQAMIRPTRIFLLDEPTSALDLRHQLEVMQTLSTITTERKAITIAAMHDLNLAARFADHIILMKAGKILAAGNKDKILTSPELAQTYGVNIELQTASDGVKMVGARL